MRLDRLLPPILATSLVVAGCMEPGAPSDDDLTKAAPGPGGLPETIRTDYGTMNVEKEYLPGVVDCELGWYTTEAPALQAQAIAARTYLARHLADNGDGANVPIGPTFQCWRSAVWQRSRDAVAATAGVVARYQGALIYANYDSGADRLAADCSPPAPSAFGYPYTTWGAMRDAYQGGARFSGYAWTQIFVTHNEGRTGAAVTPTIQNSQTSQNRGALGQYSAACLSAGFAYDTAAILRFFYGADLTLDGWEEEPRPEDPPAPPPSDPPPSDPPPEDPPPDACGGLTYQGTCEAGVITWCDAGVVYTFDCAAGGQGCGWQDDTIGYNCVAGCGELDYFGGCVGPSLRWCENAAVRVYDCSTAGLTCGWQDDTIGYNCL